MGYPGVDVLSEGNRQYWIVKQLVSPLRARPGRPGCSPSCTDVRLADGFRWNTRLWAIGRPCSVSTSAATILSWYTMEGEAKRDYPASIFHQSAW
jgi:hypothetical protein